MKVDGESCRVLNFYRDMLDEKHWTALSNKFVKDYCLISKVSSESGMLVTTEAAVLALPKLSKVAGILKNTNFA